MFIKAITLYKEQVIINLYHIISIDLITDWDDERFDFNNDYMKASFKEGKLVSILSKREKLPELFIVDYRKLMEGLKEQNMILNTIDEPQNLSGTFVIK